MTNVRTSTSATAAMVFVLGLNLRPTVTSLGAALEEVTASPGMSVAVGAVLVALPLWAYGLGGWATPWLRTYWGIHRTVFWALVALAASLVARVLGGQTLLLSGTALACLATAVIGTVLPVLARASSRARSSRLSASYTLALGGGSTAGALLTPPLVAGASWQIGLSVWAALALMTAFIWRRGFVQPQDPGQPAGSPVRTLSPSSLLHCTTARALTIYFGLVSTMTFLVMGWLPAILRDAGVPPDTAGLLHALAMAAGLPMMWLVPVLANRSRSQSTLAALLVLPSAVGVTGLLLAPAVMPWLWAVGLGLGMGGLALALTTISLRTKQEPEVTTALSGLVQGIGYVLAGAGALTCGLIHSATGGWRVPLIVLLIVLFGQVVSGTVAGRPKTVQPRPRDVRRFRGLSGLRSARQLSA